MDPLSAMRDRPGGCRMRRHAGAWGRAACAMALCIVAGSPVVRAQAPADEPETARRHAMVEAIRGRSGLRIDPRILDAMTDVPRHAFVPPAQRPYAYANRPLPIGRGQTISQPYIVALMTTLAQPRRGDTVLEIGTGSGYQAAVLAGLAGRVYSIEIIESLGAQASQRLRTLGYDNVTTRIGDGYYGWPEAGPFDAIVVTAAATSVPPPLIRQLKPGGRMVIPVGSSFFTQTLMLVRKDAEGRVHSRQVLPVRFVPLTGAH